MRVTFTCNATEEMKFKNERAIKGDHPIKQRGRKNETRTKDEEEGPISHRDPLASVTKFQTYVSKKYKTKQNMLTNIFPILWKI